MKIYILIIYHVSYLYLSFFYSISILLFCMLSFTYLINYLCNNFPIPDILELKSGFYKNMEL